MDYSRKMRKFDFQLCDQLPPEVLKACIVSSPISITVSDVGTPDMPLIYVNPVFLETTGYAYEEVLGKNCRFLQGADTNKDDVAKIRDAIHEKKPIQIDLLNYKKNGEQFINALEVAPLFDEDGNVIAFIGLQDDVTQERFRLEREVHKQRLESLGTLAGGIAHQLNNLIQPVISLASMHDDILKETIVLNQDQEVLSRDLKAMLESSRMAAAIVRDILLFARKEPAQLERVTLAKFLEERLTFIQRFVPVDVKFILEIAPFCYEIDVFIDRVLYEQVLVNLVINASHAMKRKGIIKFLVEKREGVNEILTIIRDDGPGMSKDVWKRACEPFYTTKLKTNGTGLGLSIANGIMERLEGTLEITEPNGNGCEVILKLPIK